MAYSCGYPNTMNRKGPSPLKARYTTSGKRNEIEDVDVTDAAQAVVKGVAAGDSENTSESTSENSPVEFKSNAQRKAVWASKNEKKKK